MKLLHTSDWHLGHALYGRKRYEESSAWIAWLTERIASGHIDVLLIAGDIFDNSTPANRAQEHYYALLGAVARTKCRHIIVIGGNHDSPSFLDAPGRLLRQMHVHVIGAVTGNLADEVIILKDEAGQAEAIVCAVPFLRDRDIRLAEDDETEDDKHDKLLEGIRSHYRAVCDLAEAERSRCGSIPLIVMGHLFAAGGQSVEGDGVRDLYVGSLAHVQADFFPDTVDYLALGHLHTAQRIGGRDHFRYSGSPLPLGFAEADKPKVILEVEFRGRQPLVTEIAVPCFQELVRIDGDLEQIGHKIRALTLAQSTAWLEIVYSGQAMVPDLRRQIETMVSDTGLDVRRIRNQAAAARAISSMHEDEQLIELDVDEVFRRCLAVCSIPEDEQVELMPLFHEVVNSLSTEDRQAE